VRYGKETPNLESLYVEQERLDQADSLEGATMPNGQKYEEWLKDKGAAREGGQELRPPVCQKRSGCPDLDVYRSQFEPLSPRLGPSGLSRTRSSPTTRFEEALRCSTASWIRISIGIVGSREIR
jgi:hypothetical protein